MEKFQEIMRRLRIGYYKDLVAKDSYSLKLEGEISNLKFLADSSDGKAIGAGKRVVMAKGLTEEDRVVKNVFNFDSTDGLELSEDV